MREIYSGATLVVGWIASSDGPLPVSFQTLKIVDEQKRLRSPGDMETFEWAKPYQVLCPPAGGHGTGWDACLFLSRLSYWRRVWIMQEGLLAKDLIYACPSEHISYSVLEDSSRELRRIFRAARQKGMAKPCFVSPRVWIEAVKGLAHTAPGYSIPVARQWFKRGEIHKIHLLSRGLEATRPLDYVYGLLGLSRMDITPDYNKSVAEVYGESIKWLIYMNKKRKEPYLQEFLEVAGWELYENPENLPSWLPNYPMIQGRHSYNLTARNASEEVFGMETLEAEVRQEKLLVSGLVASSLSVVGEVFEGDFDADRIVLVHFLQEFLRTSGNARIGHQCLFILYKTITQCIDFDFEDHIYQFAMWLALLDLDEDLEVYQDLPVERTGKSTNLKNLLKIPTKMTPESLALAIEWEYVGKRTAATNAAHAISVGHDICGSAVFDGFTGRESLKDISLYQFRNRLHAIKQAYCDLKESWRPVATAHGWFGLAPKKSQPGDVVCVLHKCASPVILRRKGTSYIFIGTCFVLPLMKGKIKTLLSPDQTRPQRFEIV
jgi:hypothetical protein